MTDRIEARLTELNTEYRAGQRELAELEARKSDVTNTLIRISGAIQVLQELRESDEECLPDSTSEIEPAEVIEQVAATV